MIGRLLAALVALMLPASALGREPMAFLVPAYFYPSQAGSDWDRLVSAVAAGVPMTAIMNPASGPGDAVNADYERAIAALRAAGGKVLGYVPSGYAGRRVTPSSSCKPADGRSYTAGDVIACARRYYDFYDIDGIFVDEMGGAAIGVSADDELGFYTRVYDGLKAIEPRWRIVGNPGAPIGSDLLRDGGVGGADSLVTFEGLATAFAGVAMPPHKRAARYGAILIGSGLDFGTALAALDVRGFRDLYVTERSLPNPYDRLPFDWDTQVAAVRAMNMDRR